MKLLGHLAAGNPPLKAIRNLEIGTSSTTVNHDLMTAHGYRAMPDVVIPVVRSASDAVTVIVEDVDRETITLKATGDCVVDVYYG